MEEFPDRPGDGDDAPNGACVRPVTGRGQAGSARPRSDECEPGTILAKRGPWSSSQ